MLTHKYYFQKTHQNIKREVHFGSKQIARWFLYDCDFNQMLDLKVSCKPKHLPAFDFGILNEREIIVNQHC